MVLDDFTSQLGESDARALVDLLKLAAAGRTPDANNAVKIITDVLMGRLRGGLVRQGLFVIIYICN